MLEFPVQWQLPVDFTRDGKQRPIWKLELNKQWFIVCVLKDHSSDWIVNSIEIQRINIDKAITVSGQLTFQVDSCTQIWEKKFSQYCKITSYFTEIDSNMTLGISKGILQGLVKISDFTKEEIQLKSLEQLSSDFEQLLDPESCFADVTLKCCDTSIPAHKMILSVRSPVFAAMFANPMKESHKNEVDIADIDASILQVLLNYMYTGKISDLTAALAEDLLFAADKYQLQDLKTVCSHFLKDNISLENVLRILILGDLHAEDLKSFAVDYICNECGEFSVLEKTEEWKTLRKEKPNLAVDILTSLVNFREKELKSKR